MADNDLKNNNVKKSGPTKGVKRNNIKKYKQNNKTKN